MDDQRYAYGRVRRHNADNKRTSNTGSAFFTFVDGKIASVTAHYDADSLFEQIGAPMRLPE